MAAPYAPVQSPPSLGTPALAARYREVRRFSETLIKPLSAEDCTVQSMPDVSNVGQAPA